MIPIIFTESLAYDKEDEAKTVFCGNLPNHSNVNETRVKELFQPYGEVKSVRMRSETGKIIYSKKSRKKCKSLIAYVVFKNEEDAKKSLELNGYKIHENYLRVNMANSKKEAFSKGVKGMIFVGNLSFEVTPNEVQDYFSSVGSIEYVRVIPNKGNENCIYWNCLMIKIVCFRNRLRVLQERSQHRSSSEIEWKTLQKQTTKNRKICVERQAGKEEIIQERSENWPSSETKDQKASQN